jgi:hypothetical protein
MITSLAFLTECEQWANDLHAPFSRRIITATSLLDKKADESG